MVRNFQLLKYCIEHHYGYVHIVTVDVLESVDIRQSLEGVTLAIGPDGTTSAYSLSRSFSGATSGRNWELIGLDFRTQFSIYAVFQAPFYNGSILAVNNDSQTLFDISLHHFEDLDAQLRIVLPGVPSVAIDVPNSPDNMYTFLGIKLENSRLVVIINCSVEAIIHLENTPEQLQTSLSTVTIFEQPAMVNSTTSLL